MMQGLIFTSLLAPSVLGFATPPTTNTIEPISTCLFSEVSSDGSTANGIDRRGLLAASLSSVALTAGWEWKSESTLVPAVVDSPNRRILAGVEDAVALIDSQCDRRFLHALVATDYELLYRDVAGRKDKKPSVVQVERINLQRPAAEDFSAALETPKLVEDFSGDSPFHLTTSYPTGKASMSLWPLGENVHFAWPEHEQELLWSNANSRTFSGKLVVDGVDCGIMSLEDALERPKGQVMVHANQFLLVPQPMEHELILKLKESFII